MPWWPRRRTRFKRLSRCSLNWENQAQLGERQANVRFGSKDGVIGRQLVDSEEFWVLRFRLMVKRGPCVRPHQREKRSMDHFAGLDVSVKETSVCIVDDAGKIVREAKVASERETLHQVLANPAFNFKRIGLEAGPLSQWLYSALAE